ncbi:ABC transporter permease [Oceanithermus sp.]|uniref:ABC transporter permease n=1 Tax=Oceanithermus sp. TaxID=2268145 RepID=UPI0025F24B26|nr:ABC transporter permease [Oceanithermus sp.]
MTAYIVRRLLHLIPTFLGATFLAFLVIQLAPGDFLTRLELDPSYNTEQIDNLRRVYGLDQPFMVQYAKWLSGLMKGYLGVSLSYQTDVWTVLKPRILNSMVLVGLAVVFVYVVAVPIGIYSALRQYSWGDRILTSLAFFGLAVPNFFFALLMLYFALWLKDVFGHEIFPIGGMRSLYIDGVDFFSAPKWRQWLDVLWHAILPVIVVGTADTAGLTRVMRTQMLETKMQDYVRTARAKGLSERVVVYKHILRNAIIPIVATIGFLLPGLIGGAGLVEVVMGWPGLTPMLLEALFSIDVYIIMGITAISVILLMVGNLISDLLLAWVDPRIRYS